MEIPRKVWQGLALCFSEGGARIFPASLAAARCSRFCRPCALYCRAGVHARRGRGCSGGAGWALCSSFPRNTRRCRKAPRRARSPALHCGRKRAAIRKRQPASTPDGGLRRGRVAAGRMRRPGRALPPCFAGCVAAGRVRRPGRVFARPGAAPLRRLRRHLPLQGRLLGWRSPERLPCKGSWMRRKAQTEGCIVGLWRKYHAGSGRALPYVSQRAVLASSPQTLRRPAVPGFAARAPYIVGRAFTPAGEEVAAAGLGGLYAAPFPAIHGDAARPRGGRDRPPYIAAENGRQPVNGSQLQRPATGGYAAAGRVRRPGRIFAGSGAAPLRRLRRHLPLQGRLLGWRQHTERLPCKGSLSSSSLLKAASPVKGRRWRRLPYPSTVTSVRRTWPASQASRSRMQGAGRLPAVRSTLP